MAIPAGGVRVAGEVFVQIPAAAADAAAGGGELPQRERALNSFVRVVAFGEWAGNAFGALAFVWATAVLLGGFCSDLNSETTGFLVRHGDHLHRSLQVGLLIAMSKMQLRGASQLTSRSQRCWRLLQLWAVVITFIIFYALEIGLTMGKLTFPTIIQSGGYSYSYSYSYYYHTTTFDVARTSAEMLSMVVAALLLIFRPPKTANLTSTRLRRSLLSLAKLISVVSLVFGWALLFWPHIIQIHGKPVDPNSFIIFFTTLVLSLGSLQTPAPENFRLFGCWIDVTLHMLFLWYMVVGLPSLPLKLGSKIWGLELSLAAFASIVSAVAVLLIENLQIPAAVLQVMLSSSRFRSLQSDYPQLPHGKDSTSPNMVPAIKVFYVLSICQGFFYIMASILGLFSFFPRRMLVRQSKLRGQSGAKAIDLYYESAYSTCMESGLFTARKKVSLASFAKESLSSSSSDETRLAGVLILGNLLHDCRKTDRSKELRTEIIKSKETLSVLICMLGWEDVKHRDIRLTAARVIVNLADRLTVAEIPGTLKLVSSLLDASNDDLPAHQGTQVQTTSSNWVHQLWQRMKDKWSVLEELLLTHQDSLPIMGLVILEKLAHDPDNCVEIAKSTYLISNIIGLISYSSYSENSKDELQRAVICASLNFVRRLAGTRENIGVALRRELYNNSFLLNNLGCVLEDSRSSSELVKLVIDILNKLALDEDARKEIGSCKVTICKLIHAFIDQTDQFLRVAAGEALANLTTDSPANCLVILEETGYEIINDLKNMLPEVEYIYVAASLLQNICAQAKDKLRHQDASNHLSSAFPVVMENIMSAEGKHLEVLIGLASQICDMVPEPFIHDQLQFQPKRSDLVQKLVGTLNSNRKPNPEYPRMRRVIVEMTISIVKFCPCYKTILRERGMMEALSKVEMTPSKVEKHRVFYGNIGVVLESGPSMTALVATAKGLIHSDHA